MEPGAGGGAGSQVEAPETTGLRSGELRDVTQAGAAARLVISLKAGTSLNHQLRGRSTTRGEVWHIET
jgi:hypothetical protein